MHTARAIRVLLIESIDIMVKWLESTLRVKTNAQASREMKAKDASRGQVFNLPLLVCLAS